MGTPLTGRGCILYSTVTDLFLWHEALHRRELLSTAGYKELLSGIPVMWCCNYVYGNGFLTGPQPDNDNHLLAWHNGGWTGVHTYNGWYPTAAVDVIALSNQDEDFADTHGATINLETMGFTFGKYAFIGGTTS